MQKLECLATDIQGLVNELGYDGPPEYLSMFLCFFGNRDVLKHRLHWIAENAAELKAFRKQYVKKHSGVQPIPAVLLRDFARRK